MSNEVLNSQDELLEPLRKEFADRLELYRRLLANCEYLAKRILNADNLADAHQLAQEISAAATFDTQTLFPVDNVVDMLSTERVHAFSSLKIAHQEFSAIRKTAEELEVEPSSGNAQRKAKIVSGARDMVLRLSSIGDH